MNATWQRCRVHTMRNALAHAGKSSRRVVSAFTATAFAHNSAETAKANGAEWPPAQAQAAPTLPLIYVILAKRRPS